MTLTDEQSQNDEGISIVVFDARQKDGPLGGAAVRRISPRPWWLVKPDELAARFGFDADSLADAINPDGLPDWQLCVAFDALELCIDASESS